MGVNMLDIEKFNKINDFDIKNRIARIGTIINEQLVVRMSRFLSDIYNCPLNRIKNAEITSANNKITIELCSPGGSAFDSISIYNMLKDALPKEVEVTTVALGFVASGASLIYCAGSKRFSTRGTRFMLHQPSQPGGFPVDKDVLENHREVLASFEEEAYSIYALTTGRKKTQIQKDLYRKDFYLTAVAALDYGLVTDIM